MKKSETYSAFLKAEALETSPGMYKTMQVTVEKVSSHTFDDGKKQRVLHFREVPQALGLNSTNYDNMIEVTGKDDDDYWAGCRIELYVDKNVAFGGRKMAAIRIRKPGGGNDSAIPGTLPVRDKVTAWGAFCAAQKLEGKVTPDVEFWKTLIAKVEKSSGVSKELFQEGHWQAVIDAMVPGDEPAQLKESEIPF